VDQTDARGGRYEISRSVTEKVLRGAELGLELGFLKVEQDRGMGIAEGSDFLYLTDPEGFLFSNTVISSIFAEII